MANTLMVRWPMYGLFETGEELTIHKGEFTRWTSLVASQMETGSSILEIADNRFQEILSDETQGAASITCHVAYTFPIRCLVLSCRPQGDSTWISVFVTNQNPTDHRSAMAAQTLGAVPAYWVASRLEEMWDQWYAPDQSQQMEIQRRKPLLDSPEALDARWAAWRLYGTHGCLDYPAFAQYTGYAEQKLSYAERHRNRLAHLKTIRLCVFGKHRQPDYFSPLLSETLHETLLTVEAFLFSAVSALDLLARAVDHFMCITVSPTHRLSRITFAGLLRDRDEDDSGDGSRNTGPLLRPGLPLARLWNQAWDEWIADLMEIRNSVTHNSCLLGTEVSHGSVAFQVTMPEPERILDTTRDASEYAQQVCQQLRDLFKSTFLLIRKTADHMMESVPEGLPAYSLDLHVEAWSPETSELREALDLWIEVGTGSSEAATSFYHRLHRQLQREWPIASCTQFLKQHPLKSYSISIGAGGTHERYGFLNHSCVTLDFGDRRVQCWFSTARVKGHPGRCHIIREIISTFPDLQARVEISEPWRRQSGSETGHRDVECGCHVANVTDDSLRDMTLSLLSGNRTEDYVELATQGIGSLGAKEHTDAMVRQEGGCLPPFGFRTLNGPATLRVCYTLPDGQRLAMDHPFPNR